MRPNWKTSRSLFRRTKRRTSKRHIRSAHTHTQHPTVRTADDSTSAATSCRVLRSNACVRHATYLRHCVPQFTRRHTPRINAPQLPTAWPCAAAAACDRRHAFGRFDLSFPTAAHNLPPIIRDALIRIQTLTSSTPPFRDPAFSLRSRALGFAVATLRSSPHRLPPTHPIDHTSSCVSVFPGAPLFRSAPVPPIVSFETTDSHTFSL